MASTPMIKILTYLQITKAFMCVFSADLEDFFWRGVAIGAPFTNQKAPFFFFFFFKEKIIFQVHCKWPLDTTFSGWLFYRICSWTQSKCWLMGFWLLELWTFKIGSPLVVLRGVRWAQAGVDALSQEFPGRWSCDLLLKQQASQVRWVWKLPHRIPLWGFQCVLV